MPHALSQFPKKNAQSGFALIASLSVMGFILVLGIALAALVRVETQAAESAEERLEARQNALLGLQIAMGRLQESMGRDQRVSARAEILDEDPSTLIMEGVAEPAWTGVWHQPKVEEPDDFPEGLDPRARAELVTWLVSGNSATDPLRVSPKEGVEGTAEAVRLARARGAAEEAAFHPGVRVPRESFSDGAFAYWISDEGVKTKLNAVVEDYEADPNKLLLPEGNGVSAFTELEDADIAEPSDWRRVYDLALVSETMEDPEAAGPLEYDVTFHGTGLLTDTLRGGLRYDLTTAMRLDESEFNSEFLPLMPGERLFQPYKSAPPYEGPRWNVLRLYQELIDTAVGDVYQARRIEKDASQDPAVTTQFPVMPVIEKFQFYLAFRLVDEGSDPDTGNPSYRPRVYGVPAVVLWNPYDVTINAENGYGFHFMTAYPFRIDYTVGYFDASNRWVSEEESDFDPFLGRYNWYNFELKGTDTDAVVIPPGESRVFTLSANSPSEEESDPGFLMEEGLNQCGLYIDADKVFDVDPSDLNNSNLTMDIRVSDGLRWQLKLSLNGFDNSAINVRDMYFGSGVRDRVNEDYIQPGTVFGTDDKGSSPFVIPIGLIPGQKIQPFSSNDESVPVGIEFQLGQKGSKIYDYFAENDDATAEFIHHRPLVRLNPRAPLLGTPDLPGSGGTNYYKNRNANYSRFIPRNNPFHGRAGETFENTVFDAHSDNKATFLGYSDRPLGSERAAYFSLPKEDESITSVGHLRHLDITSVDHSGKQNFGPPIIIGEGRADMGVPFNEYENGRLRDSRWIANRQFWDRFFFSTLPEPSSVPDFPLSNGKIVSLQGGTAPLPGDQVEALYDFRTAASLLGIDGAFNINSTSVRAWEALLSQFYGQDVTTSTGVSFQNTDQSPFVDSPKPVMGPFPEGGSIESTELYGGYRRLERDQINELAAAIVAEVKSRGPFLSLSGFVNRRIFQQGPGDNFTEDGANLPDQPTLADLAKDRRYFGTLQAAIEKVGLNSAFEGNPDQDFFEYAENKHLRDPENVPNRPAVMGAYMEGAPGHLSQGHLLQRLGPILSPRSDTFKIRAYGESTRFATGKQGARAYCEAIIQRVPNYLDPADDPEISPDALSSQTNIDFGRQFKLIEFKWIDEKTL
ncbi:hypothetical protein DDZ13_07800 [Coraliomargarita sinensis]|uniref:Verru_Chthon cassette protein A n=1 Tax=Coraliomargarita sinensis TaxID=2174842 RepID=A0A317ZFX1_9BACT|nr:hypothetical protein [Coraliomargarita sinensis]PXA04426.1 hypothetical protein DDZ13_07800 [Coraliomargarita sinensis]